MWTKGYQSEKARGREYRHVQHNLKHHNKDYSNEIKARVQFD